jgi:hypothetical protein
MRIRELLSEAVKDDVDNLDDLDFNDDDVEDELDNDDVEDEEETDDDDDSGGGDYDEFKRLAGKLGNELYAISMYDYSNEFSSIGPNDTILQMLEGFAGDAVIDQYIGVGEGQISDQKIISAVILNDRNNKFFAYYSGDGILGYSPVDTVQQLVSSGIVDSDQTAVLNRIAGNGARYNEAVENTSWEAGEEAEDSSVYDALDALTYSLRLPDMPAPPRVTPDSELSDEELKFRKDLQADLQKDFEDWIASQKAQKKHGGAGRGKR